MPLRRRKAYSEVRDLIPKFQAMAKEANRDLASLPISIWESKETDSSLFKLRTGCGSLATEIFIVRKAESWSPQQANRCSPRRRSRSRSRRER